MAETDLTNGLLPGLAGIVDAVAEAGQYVGAQATLAGEDIAMSPDEIEDLAGRLFEAMRTIVGQEHSQFLGAPREWAIFGGMPEALAFSQQLGAAHDVVADTVVGLRKDLENFQHELKAAVQTARTADEQAQADLLRLASRGDNGWAMGQRAAAASEEHRVILGEGSGDAQAAAASPSGGGDASAPSAPTTDSGTGATTGGFEGS